MDGLRCIDDFTLRCLDREHRAYFNTLYAGTTQVIVDLCQEGTYQSGNTFIYKSKFGKLHLSISDYLRHAPCMRLVQSGYERCAADYQTRIKALNEQTQEEHYYDDRYYEYSYEYADTTEPEYIEAKAEEALENVANDLSKRKKRQISDYPEEEAEENVKLLCCSFQKYLHCSETVVNTTCGYETAQFTKSFLDRMSGPLIQVF